MFSDPKQALVLLREINPLGTLSSSQKNVFVYKKLKTFFLKVRNVYLTNINKSRSLSMKIYFTQQIFLKIDYEKFKIVDVETNKGR